VGIVSAAIVARHAAVRAAAALKHERDAVQGAVRDILSGSTPAAPALTPAVERRPGDAIQRALEATATVTPDMVDAVAELAEELRELMLRPLPADVDALDAPGPIVVPPPAVPSKDELRSIAAGEEDG
jgi:hypothetical protein